MAEVKNPIPRIYTDTSVFGGVFEPEFKVGSRGFLEQVQLKRLQMVISDLVQEEIDRAPERVRMAFQIYADLVIPISVSAEAQVLQKAYLNAGILTPKSTADALHVALATHAGCDAIISWNFRHIVHFQRIPLYNKVNREMGYPDIRIHSPSEVICLDD